jgi:phenylalanyl-tRNA synthetase alpha subunit
MYASYVEELKADTAIDEMSLKEKALFMPGIKAKWVARLINHKNNIRNLEKQKQKLISQVIDKLKKESQVKLHLGVAKEMAENSDIAKELASKISDEKLIVDFLERVEKIFSSMSFDISNIIKIVQLETT